MVWTFIILGLLTSAWALYALIASFVARQDRRAFHIAAVVLLAAAWSLGHETGMGRLALIAAIVIECIARFRRGESMRPVAGLDTDMQSGDDAGPDDAASAQEPHGEGDDEAAAAEPPPPPEPPPVVERQPISSCVLLPTPWTVAPSVFHASLRRGGQRDAVLLDDESDEDSLVVRVGDVRIEIESVAEPELRSQVNAAARLAWEWPEASHEVRTYAAHVVFTTVAPDDAPPRDLVHLHHRAQAALAEFTSAIAVFWPDAGKLVSPANLPDLIARPSDTAAMSASCVSFRVFEPQADGEPYVLDTAGLHVLGLPDLQAFSFAEPDDSISAMLYELAERLFRSGEPIESGAEVRAPDDRVWQVELRWSDREPRRAVLSMTCEEDQPRMDEEEYTASESHDASMEESQGSEDISEGTGFDETHAPSVEKQDGETQRPDETTPDESKSNQDEPDAPSSGAAS